MAEKGSRTPADSITAMHNLSTIMEEDESIPLYGRSRIPFSRAMGASSRMRKALDEAGLKGFRRGGKVRSTGVYKLHKGELVVPKGKARMALDKVFPDRR